MADDNSVVAAQIGGKPRERVPTVAELPTFRDVQLRYDDVYRGMELGGAPVEVSGESPLSYNIRLLHGVREVLSPLLKQKHREEPSWCEEDFPQLASSSMLAFRTAEDRVLQDATAIVADATQGSFRHPGALRKVEVVDEAGRKATEFRGDPLSWMSTFMPTPSVVTMFTQGVDRGYAPILPQRGQVELPSLTVDDARRLLGDALRQERDLKMAASMNARFPRAA
jgi:hypothetical protein